MTGVVHFPRIISSREGELEMQTMILVLLLAVLPVCSAAQQNPQPDQAARQDGVAQRGDHVMGFRTT
jgi:hypothetical protein